MKRIALFVTGLALLPSAAFADIDLDFISPAGATVAPNTNITYILQGDTDGSGETDNWLSTRVTIVVPGPDITACVNLPNVTNDANNVTASVTLTSPAVDNDYPVTGTGYRHADCVTARDSKTTILHVVTPPPPPVDACPNVTGMQLEGPCADESCLSPNTWNVETQNCDAPPPPPTPIDVCPEVNGDQDHGPCANETCQGTWNPHTQECEAPHSATNPAPAGGAMPWCSGPLAPGWVHGLPGGGCGNTLFGSITDWFMKAGETVVKNGKTYICPFWFGYAGCVVH